MQQDTNNDRWGIIYVPRSGLRNSSKRWEEAMAYLNERGVQYDVVQSNGMSEVSRLTRLLIENGVRTILVGGGDAALNEAVNGIMSFGAELVGELVLGVLPNGFANNFASFWGYDEDDFKTTCEHLIRRRVRKVDVGICYYQNEQGFQESRYFINAVNVGLGASIVGINEKANRLVGVKFLDSMLSSVRLIFERTFYKVSATINYEHFEGTMMGLCVGNCLGYGQTPNAVPYNGMLDVSIVQLPTGIKQLFVGLYLLAHGKFLSYPNVLPFRTREVEIHKAPYAKISMDGRFLKSGNFPMKIKVKQECLNFIIPSKL